MMFAMSDELIATLVLGFFTTFATAGLSVAGLWIGYLTKKLNNKVEAVDLKVESVAQTGELNHAASNSAMLEMKRANSILAQALADTAPDNKVYAAAAKIAVDTWKQAQEQQRVMLEATGQAVEARKGANFERTVAPPIITVINPPEVADHPES